MNDNKLTPMQAFPSWIKILRDHYNHEQKHDGHGPEALNEDGYLESNSRANTKAMYTRDIKDAFGLFGSTVEATTRDMVELNNILEKWNGKGNPRNPQWQGIILGFIDSQRTYFRNFEAKCKKLQSTFIAADPGNWTLHVLKFNCDSLKASFPKSLTEGFERFQWLKRLIFRTFFGPNNELLQYPWCSESPMFIHFPLSNQGNISKIQSPLNKVICRFLEQRGQLELSIGERSSELVDVTEIFTSANDNAKKKAADLSEKLAAAEKKLTAAEKKFAEDRKVRAISVLQNALTECLAVEKETSTLRSEISTARTAQNTAETRNQKLKEELVGIQRTLKHKNLQNKNLQYQLTRALKGNQRWKAKRKRLKRCLEEDTDKEDSEEDDEDETPASPKRRRVTSESQKSN